MCKQNVKYAINPLENESEEETVVDDHKIKMEEGGFIMVAPE